jgi:hypothetical protein
VLGTASAALDAARRSRTESVIMRLHTLLMERWADYEARRVDVNPVLKQAIYATIPDPIPRSQMMADLRLLAQRELLKYEMPDRWSDIVNGTLESVDLQDVRLPQPTFLAAAPALAEAYYQRLRSLAEEASVDEIRDNQAAECLYMVVMLGTGDGEARTQFTDQDIGDTDGDGAPEFIDGWGNPIHYIRWPAGFNESELMSGDGVSDHDPFDMFRRDNIDAIRPATTSYPGPMRLYIDSIRIRNNQAKSLMQSDPQTASQLTAFRLVPLIFSGGPDEDPDVFFANQEAIGDPYIEYLSADDGTEARLGSPMSDDLDDDGENWHDNIHNHLLKY